jgi:hypothetical protein
MTIQICIGMLGLCLLFTTCNKKDEEANAFENATSLDCNNLRVRKVELIDVNGERVVQLSIENTCRTCTDLAAYEGLYMITKATNDTIAASCETCLAVPNNKSIQEYILSTTLTTMPDIKDIRFSMERTCRDILYEP